MTEDEETEKRVVRWAGTILFFLVLAVLAIIFPPILLMLPVILMRHWLRAGSRKARFERDWAEMRRKEAAAHQVRRHRLGRHPRQTRKGRTWRQRLRERSCCNKGRCNGAASFPLS